MSTPMMNFLSFAVRSASCIFWMWVLTICISLSYTFHCELGRERIKYQNDAWLRQKCQDPDFYINIKEHTDLCVTVENVPNLWLKALDTTISSTHVCGGQISCTDRFQTFIQRTGWQLIGAILLLVVFSPNLAYLVYHTTTVRPNRTRHGDMHQEGWSPYYQSLDMDHHTSMRKRTVRSIDDPQDA